MNYPTYLIHYGIPGQKWGNRRYQNEDGSLTPEGREHYGIKEREAKKLIKLEKKSPAAFYKRLNKNKAYKNFRSNNQDLNRYMTTTNLRQSYMDAHNREANKEARKAANGWELGDAIAMGRSDLVVKYLNAGKDYMNRHEKEIQQELVKYDRERAESRRAFEKSGEKFIKELFGEYGELRLENPTSISVDTKTGKVEQQKLGNRALTEMYRDKKGRLR